jgi:MSHA biogenesis protein MshQ
LGACPTCILTTGAFVGAGGTVVSNTATYSEVGVFQMQAYDDTFSGVDAGDGSSVAERTAYSTISTVGRFVPDHFSLTSGAVTSACTSGAPTFSYMNQSFQSVSATLQAQNATGSLTVNYDSLGFAPGSLASVAWQAENADNGTDLSARLSVPSPSPLWTGGVYSLSTAAARFRRATPDDPDGPFDNLQLGVRLIDPDGVTLNGMDMNAATAGACAPCNAKAVGSATSVRFGRLSLRNAHGSELRPLRMPVSAEYWNGIGFVTNAADSCTTVGAVSLNAPPSTCTLTPTIAGIGAALLNGSAALTLGAPNVRGCADLRITTPVWMRGHWDEASDPDGDATTTYDDNAAGRATFGTFRDRMIFRREVTR